MKKILLTTIILASALSASAQVTPKVNPEALVSGNKYVLVNKAQTGTQYTSRTSWDGALYFLGKDDSKYADHALTAIKNTDDSWSFTITKPEGEDSIPTTYYMVVPQGSGNLNVNSTDEVKWNLAPQANNFYHLILGEGNNTAAINAANSSESRTVTKDLRAHLNSGGQYFVATYYGNSWFPDCMGGVTQEDDESTGTLVYAANDSTSFNWGFVQVENIPAYYADMAYVSTINKFYSDYCNIEEYQTGFMLTYNKVAQVYADAADQDELAEAGIADMINAKVALYNEIEAAISLNESEDAVLAAAVANAKKVFDEQTDATVVNNAVETLKQAENDFAMGSGDITSLGANMSFEDLSSQNGSESSSVAGAPTGWNVYVNGKQVTTASEVSAAGIGAWHGINSDGTGEIKDGKEIFGLWNSSVPTYELSQTIVGLETGTYEITAGLMAGSNGNGSRLTTQRIFGNLNSTYYASEENYDKDNLDKTEVYAFAGNEILSTDTEMRPVTVRAFVYDGTLTFGLRTDGNIAAAGRKSSNQSGGDGWFKTDNYRITKLGYVAEDALDIFDHYVEILSDYNNGDDKMSSSVRTELENSIENMPELSGDTSKEEIIAAINAAIELIKKVDASVKLYQKLREALDKHYTYLEQYQDKLGADAYADAIQEAEDAYIDETLDTEEEIDAMIKALDDALEACIKSDVIEEGSDLTSYIKNASFEDLSNQNNQPTSGVVNAPKGWNLIIEGDTCNTAAAINAAGVTGWCGINGGDDINVELEDGTLVTKQTSDGDYLWGIWNGNIPNVELSQTLKNLPKGTYQLTADVLVQYNWAGYCITTQRIFANNYVAMYSYEDNYTMNMPEDAQSAARIDSINGESDVMHLTYAGYECESPRSDYSHNVSLTFGLAEQGDVTLGFRTNNIGQDGEPQGSGKGWFKIDNFRLTYVSETVPAGVETVDGIESASAAASATASEYYTVSGIRLTAPQRGLNIVKMTDGTTKKIIR